MKHLVSVVMQSVSPGLSKPITASAFSTYEFQALDHRMISVAYRGSCRALPDLIHSICFMGG